MKLLTALCIGLGISSAVHAANVNGFEFSCKDSPNMTVNSSAGRECDHEGNFTPNTAQPPLDSNGVPIRQPRRPDPVPPQLAPVPPKPLASNPPRYDAQGNLLPSEPTWAERKGCGNQNECHWLLGWYVEEQETAAKALHKLEDEHISNPRGIDDYLMARQMRILNKLDGKDADDLPFWPPVAPFVLYDADGKPWSIFRFSLPEAILTGFAIHRDRYCRPEDQDMDDINAIFYCFEMNRRARALFDKFQSSVGAAAR
jgi:hypothetical protein